MINMLAPFSLSGSIFLEWFPIFYFFISINSLFISSYFYFDFLIDLVREIEQDRKNIGKWSSAISNIEQPLETQIGQIW